jgi:chloride channel 3/4/5
VNAALISIITAWLSDIKLGYCTTGWWLSQKFCCLELSDEGVGCEEWRNWGGIEPFRYIFFILFAVSHWENENVWRDNVLIGIP